MPQTKLSSPTAMQLINQRIVNYRKLEELSYEWLSDKKAAYQIEEIKEKNKKILIDVSRVPE